MTPLFDKGGITLYQGDCRELLPELDLVDHVLTDPPYEIEAHARGRRVSDHGPIDAPLAFAPIDEDLRNDVAIEIGRLTQRWSLVFCQMEAAHLWAASLEAGGLTYKRTCLWVKQHAMPQLTGDRPGTGCEGIATCHAKGKSRWNGGGRSNIFHHASVRVAAEIGHPTPKPLSLMLELVKLFTDEGELVLDPFAGSGTTLLAAWRLGRRAIGIEISQEYAELAARRLEREMSQERLPFAAPSQEQELLFT